MLLVLTDKHVAARTTSSPAMPLDVVAYRSSCIWTSRCTAFPLFTTKRAPDFQLASPVCKYTKHVTSSKRDANRRPIFDSDDNIYRSHNDSLSSIIDLIYSATVRFYQRTTFCNCCTLPCRDARRQTARAHAPLAEEYLASAAGAVPEAVALTAMPVATSQLHEPNDSLFSISFVGSGTRS